MKRRTFLKNLTAGALVSGGLGQWLEVLADENIFLVPQQKQFELFGPGMDEHIKDGINKVKDFDRSYTDDVLLRPEMMGLLKSTVGRFSRLQRLVGYANFNLLGFDEAIKYASRYSKVGAFTKQELDFIESIFFEDATRYGFLGNKVITDLTTQISSRETIKLPRTGHYLFKGQPLDMYNKIKKDVGRNVILTSGIRGVVKQIHLFLAKAIKTKGNLSQASRSLAPPGHSYHGIGDFDVGKIGFGASNFTEAFSKTREYKKLKELGYVMIRYTEDNPYGVRFEPWHIKVV
ncbi:MAG: M15 family metallopeptidase [Gammaproteobacteria bacterium]|nr:M15 family metallopeptidase [Gammaproteobacteria bacterium]